MNVYLGYGNTMRLSTAKFYLINIRLKTQYLSIKFYEFIIEQRKIAMLDNAFLSGEVRSVVVNIFSFISYMLVFPMLHFVHDRTGFYLTLIFDITQMLCNDI